MQKQPPSTLTPLRQFISQHKKFFRIIAVLGGAYAFIVLASIGVFLYWFIPTWNQRHELFQERWNQSMQESLKSSQDFRKESDERWGEFEKKIKEFNEHINARHKKFTESLNKGVKAVHDETTRAFEEAKKRRKIREKFGFKGFREEDILLKNYEQSMALPDKPKEKPRRSPTVKEILAQQKKKNAAKHQRLLKKYGYITEEKKQ